MADEGYPELELMTSNEAARELLEARERIRDLEHTLSGLRNAATEVMERSFEQRRNHEDLYVVIEKLIKEANSGYLDEGSIRILGESLRKARNR